MTAASVEVEAEVEAAAAAAEVEAEVAAAVEAAVVVSPATGLLPAWAAVGGALEAVDGESGWKDRLALGAPNGGSEST